MVSRPRRPRRTFRCGDENNYALSSLSSSMCAKRCSLGSTWPGKGSLVTSVAGVVAAAVVARPSARSHGAGGRASARANAVTRSMGQSLSARSFGSALCVLRGRCYVSVRVWFMRNRPPRRRRRSRHRRRWFLRRNLSMGTSFLLHPIKSCLILRLTRTNT